MLDEVVEVVDTELLGYLDFLVGDGAKAAVFHADHDDRAGEAVTVQCQEVHLALVERASGDALCLIEHVMVQLIGQAVQVVPIGVGGDGTLDGQCHYFVELAGKRHLVGLIGQLQ